MLSLFTNRAGIRGRIRSWHLAAMGSILKIFLIEVYRWHGKSQ